MSYNLPVNMFVKLACDSIINSLAVRDRVTYDGSFEEESFTIKIFDINNNLYTITWGEYIIISNQSGVFSNKEFDPSLVKSFLKEGLIKLIGD